MNKLKTFFYSFKNSLSNRSYYRDILQTPFSFSWKYLYFLSFLVVFLGMLKFVIMSAVGLPALKPTLEKFKTQVVQSYPNELEVKVADGILTTNVEQPYYLDIPEMQKEMSKSTDEDMRRYEHFITIDTMASVEDYSSYNTLFLLTETSIVYPDRNNSALETYRVMSLSDFKEPMYVNKKVVEELVKQATPFIDSIPTIAAVLLVVSLLLTPLFGLILAGWYMFYLLLVSCISWVIARLFKANLTYAKVYQLGMHAVTLPIIVTYLLGLFGREVSLLFTAIFCLWIAMVMSKLDDEVKKPVLEEQIEKKSE